MELIIIWIACGVVGWFVGEAKGRGGTGLVLGLLLGLIGVLIVAVLPSVVNPYERGAKEYAQPVLAPVTPATLGDRLSELQSLHFAGTINDAELAAARRRVMESA